MGVSKTDFYTEEQVELAGIARALGHPARISIVQYLMKTEDCITGDIVKEIGLAQPTISQHLKVLKDVGIIRGTIEGNAVCYCINPRIWQKVNRLFNDFFGGFPTSSCC